MAHQIDQTVHPKGAVFSVKVPMWHGLGTVVEEAPDSRQAIILAGMDWTVSKRAISLSDKGTNIDGFKATVRNDSNAVLGIVTDSYQIIQNRQAFDFTDGLLEGGDMVYETAGVLDGGRRIWILAKLTDEFKILGDPFICYLCFTSGHDGKWSTVAFIGPQRIVCQNTLTLAINRAIRKFSIQHRGDVRSKLQEASKALLYSNDYMKKLQDQAESLVKVKMTPDDWSGMVNHLLPKPTQEEGKPAPSDLQIQNAVAKQADLHKRLYAPDLSNFRNTGWGAINAVTNYVAHRDPARQTATWQQNRFADIFAGDKMVDRAQELILALAN